MGESQILDLLGSLRRDLGIGIILITHDLGIVAGMADEIAVMYAGRVVEQGATDPVFHATAHPYTAGLIAAVPSLEGKGALRQIEGTPPSIFARPSGCAFHPRCTRVRDECRSVDPPLEPARATRAACHAPLTGDRP